MITIIAPLDSAPTTVTHRAALSIYEELRKSEDVRMLSSFFATHWPLKAAESLRRSEFLIYLGHGSKKGLLGQMPLHLIRLLLSLSDNNLTRDRKIVTVACYAWWYLREVPKRWATGSKTFMTVAYPTPGYDYAADFVDTWKVLILTAVKKDDPHRAVAEYKKRCSYYIAKYEKERRENWDVYAYGMRINRDYYSIA